MTDDATTTATTGNALINKSGDFIAAEVKASATVGTAKRVPDQPCLKCGDNNVSLHYCVGGGWHSTDDRCSYGEPEHFHRNCRRCGYWWRTNDVIPRRADR